MFGRRTQPLPAHQEQFVEDEPFSRPWNDRRMKIIHRTPWALSMIEEAQTAFPINVCARVVLLRNDRIAHADLGNAALPVTDADPIPPAVFRRNDAADAFQNVVTQFARKDGKVALNQLFLENETPILRNSVAPMSIRVSHRICGSR